MHGAGWTAGQLLSAEQVLSSLGTASKGLCTRYIDVQEVTVEQPVQKSLVSYDSGTGALAALLQTQRQFVH